MNALRTLVRTVRADFAYVQSYRAKYHEDAIPLWRLPLDFVTRVGFQMMVIVRVMQFFRHLRIPLAPMVVSRLIRHVYGAEIHWDADIAGGVCLVHGVGIVISHAAHVGPGCILFQNLTLGESVDPITRQSGAPTLEQNVHVGPGAVLLGPITVGAGSKIMAGSILDRSVPPNSLVRPSPIVVTERPARTDRPGDPGAEAATEG